MVQHKGTTRIETKVPRWQAITFHSARHSFATYMIDKGVPIAHVQKILGHADIKTTQVYINLSQKNVAQSMLKAFDD